MSFENLVPLRYTKFRQPVKGDMVIAPLGKMVDFWEPSTAKVLEAKRHQCCCFTCSTFGSVGSVTLRLAPHTGGGHSSEDVRWCVGKGDVARPLKGATPLHGALAVGAGEASVLTILEAAPAAAKAKTSFGLLPLHVALETPQTTKTRLAILRAYPEAAFASLGDDDRDHPVGGVALHAAVYQNADFLVIQALLRINPTAAAQPDKRGKYPIHIALRYKADDGVISALVRAFPACAELPYPFLLDVPVTDRHCNPLYSPETQQVPSVSKVDKKTDEPTPLSKAGVSSAPTQTDISKTDEKNMAPGVYQKSLLTQQQKKNFRMNVVDVKTQQLSSPTLLMATVLSQRGYGALRCAGKRGRIVARLLELRSPTCVVLNARPSAAVALAELSRMTPLHVAAHVGAPVTILKALVKAAAAERRRVGPDALNNLPIHIALLRKAPPRVLKALLPPSSEGPPPDSRGNKTYLRASL